MSISDESTSEASCSPSGPSIIDGRPTRGPVVLAQDKDEVAVWQIDLAGNPCGAWVFSYDGLTTALRLLALCDRRGLVSVDPVEPIDLVLRWAKDAEVEINRETLESRLCLIGSFVAETTSARKDHTAAVQRVELTHGKRLAPLVWERAIPDPVPETLDEWSTADVIPRMDADSAGDRARQIAALSRYLLFLWADTETRRSRRPYLREEFGPSQPLPQSWKQAVVRAHETPFDLPHRSDER